MKFKSKYLGLTVYTENGMIEFRNGEYETKDKKEIAILQNTLDVEVIDEVKEIK